MRVQLVVFVIMQAHQGILVVVTPSRADMLTIMLCAHHA